MPQFRHVNSQKTFPLFHFSANYPFPHCDFSLTEYSEIFQSLDNHCTTFADGKMWYRKDLDLFCERKLCIAKESQDKVLLWLHQVNGHPGPQRTVLLFSQSFHAALPRSELLAYCKNLLSTCPNCLRIKQNNPSDRGLVSSLPIPQISNYLLYNDFVQMDDYNHHS